MFSVSSRAICISSTTMAILVVGCAKYRPEPLPMLQYNEVMASRSAADANVEATTSITLPEAERVALYLNPRLRAARQAANVAAVDSNHAGMWSDPVLSGNFLHALERTEHRWLMGGALLFTIPISGRLNVEKDKARAEFKEAVVEAWGEEQRVLLELRGSWIEWAAAYNARQVLANERTRYESASGYVEPLTGEERFAATDASMLRIARLRVEISESRLAATEEQARLRVLGLMGLGNVNEMRLEPTTTVPEWAGTADDIYRVNPQVLLREAQYEVAEQALRLEIRKQYPDLSLGPVFEQRAGKERLGLGFSLPIPILNGNRGNIASARARRDAARASWESAVEQSFTSLAAALSARDMARQRAESARTMIPTTESQVSDTRTRLEGEDRSTLLLVDSVGIERESKMSLVDAEVSMALENAALWAIIPAEAPAATPAVPQTP